ncbi:MAG: hypothetical protein QM487_08630 [Candidatus Marithrix sp.]
MSTDLDVIKQLEQVINRKLKNLDGFKLDSFSTVYTVGYLISLV